MLCGNFIITYCVLLQSCADDLYLHEVSDDGDVGEEVAGPAATASAVVPGSAVGRQAGDAQSGTS